MVEAKQGRRWLLDREVEEATGGRISKSRLRKDRIGEQLFPFHRVGRSVYYSLAEIEAVIERNKFGGEEAGGAKRLAI